MPQPSARTQETRELQIPTLIPAELAEIGKRQFESFAEVQAEFLDTLETISKAWLERTKSEANITSEIIIKLVGARTMPETTDAYREYWDRRMGMLADDNRRLLDDSQKLIELGLRILTNGVPRKAA